MTWYPIADDTIGGFAVGNCDIPVSHFDVRSGEQVIICCMVKTFEEAKQIADALNRGDA